MFSGGIEVEHWLILSDTKNLIDTDDFPDDITLKDVVILITCVTKYGDKFYPQLFL